MSIDQLFSLKDQVTIVTGGGNGIGRACALMLAQAGSAVTVSDLKRADAEAVAEDIRHAGGQAIAVECNVTIDEQLVETVEKTIAAFGKVTILVNNAGGGGGGKEDIFKISVEDFAFRFQLNVFSAWRLIQLCAPHMKRTGNGSIVNITSMSSITTSHNMSAYGSSKAALNKMTEYLAMDLGPQIRVNAVGPGAIKTAALATVLTPEIEKAMVRNTPLGVLGEPDDIAAAVLYLCSPAAKWVSGQILFVNGGGVQTLD